MSIDKQFMKAVKQGDTEVVRALGLENPHLVHLRDAEEASPLHYAAWKGHVEVTRALVDLGADVNACSLNTHYGGTPLHAAAHANHKEIVALLLESGCDRDVISCNGRSALQETEVHRATAAARLLRYRAATRKGTPDTMAAAAGAWRIQDTLGGPAGGSNCRSSEPSDFSPRS